MELWFYHLERSSLDQVLPTLLEKTRTNSWRALISSPDPERLKWLEQWLWTYRDDSFLAHGSSDAPRAEQQPVLLTGGHKNENNSQIAFLLDGADPDEFTGFERLVLLFDGADEAALQNARTIWKKAKDKEQDVRYWKQNTNGKWENLA